MRFMITAARAPGSEPRTEPPGDEVFAAYMKFNEDMAKAGVLIASEGLNPVEGDTKIGVSNGKRAVLDGPFAESKELVGGFYLIEVASRQEAIDWALRCPVGMDTADVLTIHRMTEASDIPPEYLDVIRKVAPTWSASFTKSR